MDIVKVFGTNLKKYRTQKGMSQEKFADFLQKSHRFIRIC